MTTDTTTQKLALYASIARGQRLKLVRKLTGLARKDLEEKYALSANTLQSWEVAKKGGLTKRGAQRMLEVIKAEGIRCTLEWLLYGTGALPQATNQRYAADHPVEPHNLSEAEIIAQELQTFCMLHPDALAATIIDSSMEPYYQAGDQVAGRITPREAMHYLIGENCIIRTSDNNILVRQLRSSSRANFYDLVCTNPVSKRPLLTNQYVMNAAPVSWHRRRDSRLGMPLMH